VLETRLVIVVGRHIVYERSDTRHICISSCKSATTCSETIEWESGDEPSYGQNASRWKRLRSQ